MHNSGTAFCTVGGVIGETSKSANISYLLSANNVTDAKSEGGYGGSGSIHSVSGGVIGMMYCGANNIYCYNSTTTASVTKRCNNNPSKYFAAEYGHVIGYWSSSSSLSQVYVKQDNATCWYCGNDQNKSFTTVTSLDSLNSYLSKAGLPTISA